MSLSEAMSSGKSRKKLSVTDIRMNQLNAYAAYNIEELAHLIKRDGQLENLTVYADDCNDGKHYTLLGGHRRYLAISLLLERGESDGLADVVVVRKPENEIDEKSLIQSDNAQRIKTMEEIKWEIQSALEKWDYLCSQDQQPVLENGEKKRDWIGRQVGLKGRQVQEYLTGRFSEQAESNNGNETANGSNSTEREITVKDITKNIKKAIKGLDKAMEFADELALYDTKNEIEGIINLLTALSETVE